jgi:PBSX family phage terminase large subunit
MPKINEKHKLLYTSEKRYVYEKGGRGSSKSFTVSDYAIRITYDEGRVVLLMRYTMKSASLSIIPEFEESLNRLGIRDEFNIVGDEIVNKLTGSKIIFKGVKTSSLNQTANLKSIQGLTDVIYDEFEEHPDQDSFDKLDESIRTLSASNRLVLVSNALHKKSWQYLQFWDESGLYYEMTDHIKTTWRDNRENLSESWHTKRKIVQRKNIKKYNRDFEGEDYEDMEGALWTSDMIKRTTKRPDLKIIAVAVDPAVTSNANSDEHGIITGGIGYDNKCYIFADDSGVYTPNGMAKKVVLRYDREQANKVIGEANNGGDFIESVIKNIDSSISYKSVHASRGKAIRAEPVVSLYEEGRVIHVGDMSKLEQELTSWNPETDSKSPNRLDACVWLVTFLLVKKKELIVV